MKYALIQTDDAERGFRLIGTYKDIESAKEHRDRLYYGTYIIVQVF